MQEKLKINLIFLIVLFLFLTFSSTAEVKLAGVINCNMVFQRDHDITVWGVASKGEKVSVTFNKIIKKTKTDSNGKWKVIFPAMQAGGLYGLNVQGKNLITLENILIGDVWICSGQSNMAMALSRVNNAAQEIAQADYPSIRLLQYPSNFQKDLAIDVENASWTVCSPKTIPGFSAVAYFFGRDIYKETNIPIGLINTSRGGTNAEAWTSMDYLVKIEKYKKFPSELAENLKKTDSLTVANLKNPNTYHTSLFNGMINPLLNLSVKGVIWYQGEQNASEWLLYRTLFPNLIECWRAKWNQPDMPFLFVQRANYTKELPEPAESNWAGLREA